MQELSKCKVMLEEGGRRKEKGRVVEQMSEGSQEEGGRDREGGGWGTLLDSPTSKSTEGERQEHVAVSPYYNNKDLRDEAHSHFSAVWSNSCDGFHHLLHWSILDSLTIHLQNSITWKQP